jgi:hypothetical protein
MQKREKRDDPTGLDGVQPTAPSLVCVRSRGKSEYDKTWRLPLRCENSPNSVGGQRGAVESFDLPDSSGSISARSFSNRPCAGYLGHPFGKIENKQTSAQWRGRECSSEQGERQHLLLLPGGRKPEEDKQLQES